MKKLKRKDDRTRPNAPNTKKGGINMPITVLGKKSVNGISQKTGNRYQGTIIQYSYDDANSERGKSVGSAYVSEILHFGDNINIFSDYELELDPVKKYATRFELVELDSYFKQLK